MFDRIIKASLQHRFVVLLIAALMMGWGLWSAIRMPVDVFPDLTAPTVTVATEAHGMAPQEVEQLITRPIESALLGAAGVRRVRSVSQTGISLVFAEFEWEVPIQQARQVVTERLSIARSSLPADSTPTLTPISSIMGEILFVAVVSDKHSPMELRTEADWSIRRRLLSVPGVSQVVPIGGEVKQFQVVLRPDRLAAYQIGAQDVAKAVEEAGENSSAGFLVHQGQEYLIHGLGRLRGVEDLEQAWVATRGGQPVRLKDVAQVKIGPALKRGEGSHDGKPAVILGIQKQPGANTLDLTKRLDEVMAEVQKDLPQGMQLKSHIFRQSDFIQVAIANVRDALRDGTLLVLLIVGLFLAHKRATLITAVAVPLSLVAAVLALKAFGTTLNTMTLGGMALAVGDLVDDAIVDVENVLRRLRENMQQHALTRRAAFDVVFSASSEIRSSIVYATAIIIVVFLPIFFLGGVEGRLLQPLGIAFTVSLAASLLVALTVTPAMCLWLLPKGMSERAHKEGRAVQWVKAKYEPLLAWAMPRWKTMIWGGAAGLGLAAGSLFFAGRSFLPEFNEGTLTLSLTCLPGTPLEVSDRLGRQVEQILLKHPEVVATARRTGRAELDEHAMEVFASEIDAGLKMKRRSKEDLLAALRMDLAQIPGVHIAIGQPLSHRIDHLLSGSRAAIAVKLFGTDRAELKRLAEAAKAQMAQVPGVVDLMVEASTELPILSVRPDRAALAQAGLSSKAFAHVLELAFAGEVAGRVREAEAGAEAHLPKAGPQGVAQDVRRVEAAFDVLVRMERGALQDAETLGDTLISTPSGGTLPLKSLASVSMERGPSAISRENGQRKMVVTCNLGGRDLFSVVQDIRTRLESQVPMPQGYHVEFGGQFESGESAARNLVLMGIGAIAAVFGLLFMAFKSTKDATLIMLNLPLAWMGGVAGVYFSGGVLSVATLIGFITLFGIATRNGIMLVSHIHHLMDKEGVTDLEEAVRRAARERLAPILMTALTAGLALVPIILRRHAPGSEIQAPMASVILFGLVSSTALNMLVVPSLYLRFGSKAGQRRKDGGIGHSDLTATI